MSNTSIQLLNSLSIKEISRFSHFVESAYFNKDKNIIKLWALLKKQIIHKRAFDENWQAKIFNELFGKQQSKDTLDKKEKALLNAKMSLLIDLMRRFLIIENLEQKKSISSELLFEQLLERQQLEVYERQLNKERKILQQQTLKDFEYYQMTYTLENGIFNFLHEKRLLEKEDNLEAVNFNLDMQYILKKLKLQSTALSIKIAADRSNYNLSMKAVDQLTQLTQYSNEPLILLHLVVINLMESNDEKNFLQLLNLLDQHYSEISNENLNDFYTVASNFCVEKILKGALPYNQKLYEVYKKMDERNLLTQDGLIDIQRLKNIVGLSCRLKDFKWANVLVEKYQDLVRHKDVKSIAHFNLGTIAFYEANYKRAISHFIRVKKINTAFDINSRMMLVKSHYELDKEYDERTMTIFRSTERFITKQNTLSSSYKKSFKNFTKLLMKVYKLKFNIGKVTLEKVIRDINSFEFISDKKWLLDKLNEIK